MTHIVELVSQGETRTFNDHQGKPFNMREVVVRTLEEYPQTFVAATFGKLAGCTFAPGDLLIADLGFTVREYDGRKYQDVTARHLRKINY